MFENICDRQMNRQTDRQMDEQMDRQNNVQSGLLLLRYCHVPRMNYLRRTVAPKLIELSAALHDQLYKSTFQWLVRCPDLTDDQWL